MKPDTSINGLIGYANKLSDNVVELEDRLRDSGIVGLYLQYETGNIKKALDGVVVYLKEKAEKKSKDGAKSTDVE